MELMRGRMKLFFLVGVALSLGLVSCSDEGGRVDVSARAVSVPAHGALLPLAHGNPPLSASLLVTIQQVRVHLAGDGDHDRDGDIDDDDRDHDGDHRDGGDRDDHGEEKGIGLSHRPDGHGPALDRDGGHQHADDGDDGHDDDDDEADGGAKGDEDEGEDDGGWFTVFQGAQAIDLLDPAASEAFLGGIMVPAGRITQVRVVLDPAMKLVLDGKSFDVGCASCTHSGIKIVIPGGIVVMPGGSLDLSLDFDVLASLVIDGNGAQLRPVIRIVEHPPHK